MSVIYKNLPFAISFFFLLFLFSCKQGNQLTEKPALPISLETYDAEWQEIARMEKKGLGKTIVSAAEELLQKAVIENNPSQVFKALVYRSKYIHLIQENSDEKIIRSFEEQIDTAAFPLKQLLHSAVAQLYFQYYQRRKFQIGSQIRVKEGEEKNQLSFWSLDAILERINFHYQQSLHREDDLADLPLSDFMPVLEMPTDSMELKLSLAVRPSIYDLLLQRAMDYYKQDVGQLVSSLKKQTNQRGLFVAIPQFVSTNFDSSNFSSSAWRLLQLYQKALKWHQDKEDPTALIDYNLDRLKHYYQSSKRAEIDSLYLHALQEFSDQYADLSVARNQILFQIARLYFRWGNRYRVENKSLSTYRFYLKKAHQLCDLITVNDSFAAEKANKLKKQIESRKLHLRLEKEHLPEAPMLFRLDHKNMDTVFFSLVKIPYQLDFSTNFQEGYRNKEALKAYLLSKTPIRRWHQVLPNSGDFQEHHLEIYTQGQEKGNYYLLAANQANFQAAPTFSMANFTLSRLSYFSRNHKNQSAFEVYLRDRGNGKAIAEAKMAIYDLKQSPGAAYRWELDRELQSDKNGLFSLKERGRQASFRFYFHLDGDTLMSENSHFVIHQPKSERKQTQTYFYTDRAIYRPGQTVFFKGLVVEKIGEKQRLKTNFATLVALYNANGEKLNEIEVRTNEYGSYSGSFVLPEKGLTGSFRIQDENKMHRFLVEEYKRPTFKIEVENFSGQLKLDQAVQIQGVVEAYSSEPISQAKVDYRIVRKVVQPMRFYSQIYPPPTNPEIIESGNLISDKDGKFQFEFTAPSQQAAKKNHFPTYHFQLILEATSPTGESQQLSKHFQLSHQALFLKAEINERLQLQQLKKFVLQATNLGGEKIAAQAELQLVKLKVPEKVKFSKKWDISDQQLISEKEYESLFPHFYFGKDLHLENFEEDYLLSSMQVNCNQPIDLFNQIKAGAYLLKANAEDAYGNTVNWEKRFILFDEKSDQLPFPIFAWFHALQEEAEPGDSVQFLLGTGLDELSVLFEVERNGKVIEQKWLKLHQEQRRLKVPIRESDRGNITVRLLGIHSNRFFQHEKTIKVPYSNKKLALKLTSFRNKTTPSAKENWTLEVKSPDGIHQAEVLLSMYDASLDQFVEHPWKLDLYHANRTQLSWNFYNNFRLQEGISWSSQRQSKQKYQLVYPRLNWFGFHLGGGFYRRNSMPMTMAAGVKQQAIQDKSSLEIRTEEEVDDEEKIPATEVEKTAIAHQRIRSDFRETAFFYPEKEIDDSGKVKFSFQMPDALTTWKFRAIAHSKELKSGYFESSIQSKKDFMVKPNYPRFFRVGDTINLKAMVQNMSKQKLLSKVRLEILDIREDRPLDFFLGSSSDQSLKIAEESAALVSWKIAVPKGIRAVKIRFSASSGEMADAEEKIIPVLSNRLLLTESLPLFVKANQNETYRFEKLIQSARDQNIIQHAFSIELSPNPAWYAVQAMPVMLEKEDENTEQLFARLFSNSLAQKIIDREPQLKTVFQQWKLFESGAFNSKLEENQELKTMLIGETPWVEQAKNEREQKRQLALLFDLNRMREIKEAAIQQLQARQLSNGAWPWHKGLNSNRFISRYLLEGFGKLKKMGVSMDEFPKIEKMLKKGLFFIDRQIEADYQNLLENRNNKIKDQYLHAGIIHYFYMRSFYPDFKEIVKGEAQQFYLEQLSDQWQSQSPYFKAMIALSMHRLQGKDSLVTNILKSLKDQAIMNEKEGMYWKMNAGPYWHQAPIVSQALLMEAFWEINKDENSLEMLKLWLLRQKQYQAWSNSKATAQAVYALLMEGSSLLQKSSKLKLKTAEEKIDLEEEQVESGTNYFKKTWLRDEVKTEMGKIEIQNDDSTFAWGAAHWQYEQLQTEVTAAEVEGLSISRRYFEHRIQGTSEELIEVKQKVQLGDLITVRIYLKNERDLEFVLLKDMRPPAFEPLDVVSGRKFQSGLSYYQSTKDASTNFYFDRLPKGEYVFEYEVKASQSGKFFSGISQIQSYYAPEFSAQTKGRWLKISSE